MIRFSLGRMPVLGLAYNRNAVGIRWGDHAARRGVEALSIPAMAIIRMFLAGVRSLNIPPFKLGKKSCKVWVVRVSLKNHVKRKQAVQLLKPWVVGYVLEIFLLEIIQYLHRLGGESLEKKTQVLMGAVLLNGRTTPKHGVMHAPLWISSEKIRAGRSPKTYNLVRSRDAPAHGDNFDAGRAGTGVT